LQAGFGFDLLCKQFAEDHLLRKVLGANDRMIGARR
jgi:hypothetical protein